FLKALDKNSELYIFTRLKIRLKVISILMIRSDRMSDFNGTTIKQPHFSRFSKLDTRFMI
ncbi:MAG: hypothetical protein KAS58_03775, partial [Calditrichia bacterium]|nr:hypothetical protein [Calditrichia bacterium]